MAKTMNKSTLIFLLFSGILLSVCACAQKPLSMDSDTKFSWLAEYSAPKYYPVDLYTGYFGNEEGFITGVGGSGSTHKGMWGSSAATIISGPEYKAIPSVFSITWIAFAEKKTYRCEGKLDQQKILRLFQEGLDVSRNAKRTTYNKIVVGMAPGGLVSIWLSGAGVITEVGNFQGVAAPDVAVEDHTPNPMNLSRTELIQQGYEDEVDSGLREQLDKGLMKIPVGLWQTYRTKYLWKPEVELPAGMELVQIVQRYFNGEAEVLLREGLQKNRPAARAVPRSFDLTWQSADTVYVCRPELKEEDPAAHQALINVFAEVMGKESNEPGTFVMRVDAGQTQMRFFVKKGAQEVEIKGFKYRIFRNKRKENK